MSDEHDIAAEQAVDKIKKTKGLPQNIDTELLIHEIAYHLRDTFEEEFAKDDLSILHKRIEKILPEAERIATQFIEELSLNREYVKNWL